MNVLFDYINLFIQIILAVGVFILFWQVKTQVTESRYDRTLTQLQTLENPDFYSKRVYVLREWDGEFPLDRENELMIRDFLHRMENLGALYLRDYIDKDLIRDLYAQFIVHAWYRCEPFIEKEKSERQTAMYAEHFKMMHLHVMRSFNKTYPNNMIKAPENVFPKARIASAKKKGKTR